MVHLYFSASHAYCANYMLPISTTLFCTMMNLYCYILQIQYPISGTNINIVVYVSSFPVRVDVLVNIYGSILLINVLVI